MKISFTIKGTPQSKERHRSAIVKGGIHNYTPAQTKEYEERVQVMYLQAYGWRLYGPIKAEITAFYKIPDSWPQKRKMEAYKGLQRPQTKPDCDNIAKVILDALNGTAYEDDKQVIILHVEKYYADVPRVEVTLETLTGEGNGEEN